MNSYDQEYYLNNREKIRARTKVNSGSKGVQGNRLKAKSECRRLANYTCQLCHGEGLDAHHIIPVEEGGSDEQENLICLCRSCHQKVHKGTLIIIKDSNGYYTSKLNPTEAQLKRLDQINNNKEKHERARLKRMFKALTRVFKENDNNTLWHACAKLSRLVDKYELPDLYVLLELNLNQAERLYNFKYEE